MLLTWRNLVGLGAAVYILAALCLGHDGGMDLDRRKELGKALLTLGTGVVLAGGLKMVLDENQKKQDLVKMLLDAYNQTKLARRRLRRVADNALVPDAIIDQLNEAQLTIELVGRLTYGGQYETAKNNGGSLRRMETALRELTDEYEANPGHPLQAYQHLKQFCTREGEVGKVFNESLLGARREILAQLSLRE